MNESSSLLINADEGIRLMGGDPSLYGLMLSRFAQDPTMNRLEEALLRSDVQDAFLQAHTLKGLCAQLALPRLHDAAASLCDLLREQSSKGILPARDLLPDVLSIYLQTLQAIACH